MTAVTWSIGYELFYPGPRVTIRVSPENPPCTTAPPPEWRALGRFGPLREVPLQAVYDPFVTVRLDAAVGVSAVWLMLVFTPPRARQQARENERGMRRRVAESVF